MDNINDKFVSRGTVDLVDGCYSYGLLIHGKNYGVWKYTSNGLHYFSINAKNEKVFDYNDLYEYENESLPYVWKPLNKELINYYYDSQAIIFSDIKPIYPQNLFLLSNTNKLKKYYVIDELSNEQIEKYDNLSFFILNI